ncbi:ATP-binding protein [Phycicoccus sp.]|uniref:sensor histidine kinase n=1 Tax=Phycicoccus sp. TaxID=1902410 RepID=UPI002BC1026F|nr:ATP-binding protein [Phycicoccus sp.]HMM97288.1 ATP-binding protein [Phycicoccus sp.]
MTRRLRVLDAAYQPSRWTLRTKLLAGVLVLFLVVMLATSALTVLETRRYLDAQLTKDLQNALGRTADRRGVIDTDGDGDGRHGGGPPGAPGGDNTLVLGLTSDGAVATDPSGYPLNQVLLSTGRDGVLSTSQIAQVADAVDGTEVVRVDVGNDLGEYLVTARTLRDGGRFIVGVSTRPVDQLLGKLLALVVAGTGIGLVLVGAGGAVVVRRSLAPLDRVAATARQVSSLQLDSGDVSLAVRVPEEDADGRTEVGQVGLALNTMLDDVEQALRARQDSEMRVRQFVADASHELRTPLASIRGYAELTRREREPVPENVSHAIGRVESEALRMQELVEDLLLLARLDSGRPLEREPVDLSLLAMNAVSDAHAASPDHAWELDLPEDPVEVTGDGARLHQILANLLANARTHTPSGTRVVTRLRPEGRMVRISVSDNGPGIPPDLQPKVFERFTRGDDSRSRANGSTGLGLSIVAAVGQAHGGRVEVSSEPGTTTFSVLLPTA